MSEPGSSGQASRRVAVVVDSSAGIPARVVKGQGLSVVPCGVVIDGETRSELDVTGEDVLAALNEGRDVGTTSPSTGALAALYEDLAGHGAEEIVSVHMSSKLSGTAANAGEAAAAVAANGGPTVHVVDSLSIGMGLGWVALTAAGAAASGMPGSRVRDLAIRTSMRTSVLFTVYELDHLKRFGRLGGGQSAIGNALGIKPVFRMHRGELTPSGRMRGVGKAIDRITEIVEDSARGWPVHVTVQHAGAPAEAATLADRIAAASVHVHGAVDILPAPPVIVARTGVVVGVVVSPTDWD